MAKRTPLYAQIRSYLLDQIHSGAWRPDDRMPSENELAEQFGVSRITIKSALSILVEEGVVYQIQGRGTFVSKATNGGEPVRYAPGKLERTSMVALLIPTIDNGLMKNIMKGIEAALASEGIRMLLCQTQNSHERERELLQHCVDLGVSGLIVYPVDGETYSEEILRLTLDRFPIVVIDRYLKGIETNCVCSDHYGGAYELTAHLLAQGHKRIAFVSTPHVGTTSLEERLEGYKQALADHHLPVEQELIYKLTEETTISDFIDRCTDVTAVFAANVGEGLELMKVAASRGIQVPDQLSVVFFDDYDYSDFARIPPTCVVQQELELGQEAASLLLSVIRNPGGVRRKIVLPTRLVVRGSSAGVSSK